MHFRSQSATDAVAPRRCQARRAVIHSMEDFAMKRRSFLKNTGLAGILAAGSAPAFAQAAPEVKWRLASSFPSILDTIYGGTVTISELFASATHNKFTTQLYCARDIA